CAAAPGCWVEGGVLLWFVKPGPLPVPVLTLGDPADPVPGALGQPGTQVLSGSSLEYGVLPGLRAMVCGWFDTSRTCGAAGCGFFLFQATQRSSTFSDHGGNPALFVPLFRPDTGKEGSFTLSDPLQGFTGGLAETSTLRLWGLEANALWAAYR